MRFALFVFAIACVACGKRDRDDTDERVSKYVEPVQSAVPTTASATPSPNPTPTTLESAFTPTPPTSTCPNPLDKGAVVHALEAISYKGCAAPGTSLRTGNVDVSFAPGGSATTVSVIGPFLSAEVSCVRAAFAHVSVPPFCPPARSVGWEIHL